MTHLDMNHNMLSGIPTVLQDMTSLTILELSYNEITVIDWGIFEGMESLRKLYLEGNPVTAMENTQTLPSINVLYITPPSGYAVRDFPQMTGLVTLTIEGQVVSFDGSSTLFEPMQELRHLTYASQGSVSVDDLQGLPTELQSRLISLNLANNSLSASKASIMDLLKFQHA